MIAGRAKPVQRNGIIQVMLQPSGAYANMTHRPSTALKAGKKSTLRRQPQDISSCPGVALAERDAKAILLRFHGFILDAEYITN